MNYEITDDRKAFDILFIGSDAIREKHGKEISEEEYHAALLARQVFGEYAGDREHIEYFSRDMDLSVLIFRLVKEIIEDEDEKSPEFCGRDFLTNRPILYDSA